MLEFAKSPGGVAVRKVLSHPVIDIAIRASTEALPERLSVGEMAAAAGASLWSALEICRRNNGLRLSDTKRRNFDEP